MPAPMEGSMQHTLDAAPQASARALASAHLWPSLFLAALALLTRLPFQSQLLYHWDSVNFARALERFDVASGQPHAPGYPLYIVLGHLAARLAGGAQAGYVALAVLGSAIAVVALYDLGRRMWGARVGLLAGLLLLSSPLFWFYGEVALPHALDAAAVVIAATLCWRVWHGERQLALFLALWLGLIGGFRQQTLVFMFPLALLAWSGLPLRTLLALWVVLGLTVLAWMLPLLMLSGGAGRYFAVVSEYTSAFNAGTSVFMGAGWPGVSSNLGKLARYTLWGWAFGLTPALAGLWPLWRARSALLRDRRLWFLLAWATPCLAFYTLIHMGQQGLIFVYLPVLMLLSAAAGLSSGTRAGTWLLVAWVACNGLLFLATPTYPLQGRLKVLSLATIRDHDALLRGEIAAVHANLPAGAVLLADEWRFPEYYLPEVPLVRYPTRLFAYGEPLRLSSAEAQALEEATALAWYEPAIDEVNRAADRTALLPEHSGVRLRILRRSADERFRLSATGITVEAP